jgi:hypothetical protein
MNAHTQRGLTMEDWNKEQMEQYFDTSELLKQLNEMPSAEKKSPQKQKFSLLNTKRVKNQKEDWLRRFFSLENRTRNNQVR